MPTPITRYKCDFCKRTYSKLRDAAEHEKKCLYNPANKSCSTCWYATDNHCMLKDKEIFKKFTAIRNCNHWVDIIDGLEDEEA